MSDVIEAVQIIAAMIIRVWIGPEVLACRIERIKRE